MKLYDQHLHSKFSFDCRTEPRANVEAAVARGLAGLVFTEHFDTNPNDWDSCVYDDQAYSDEIAKLAKEYAPDLFVGKGIEVCFQPARMDFILDFLSRHRFDMVMLSVHYFGGVPVHRKGNWEGMTVHDGTRLYLENVREAARFCEKLHAAGSKVFDVLGHLDVVKRYSHRYAGGVDLSGCEDVLDDILRALIAADVVPEINTSSLRQGLHETMPNATVLSRYRELGGRAVSIGSDSHRSDDIGAGFDHAIRMIKQVGIENLALFRRRDRQLVPATDL